MTYRTRFSPSTTGGLHLGHIYTALVNQHMAHETGGMFTIRIDDTHIDRVGGRGLEMNRHIERQMRNDMDWLGFEYDLWSCESELQTFFDQWRAVEKHEIEQDTDPDHFIATEPHLVGKPEIHLAPYSPWVTAERVVFDWLQKVNLVIRGEELIPEYTLYCHYCRIWNLPTPHFMYLPRLRVTGDIEISKTKGNYQVSHMRANGYTAKQIIEVVERACLIAPYNGWHVWNLKAEPRL